MNYVYKDKLYTIRKIDIKDFTQFEGKWYPTVFYENEEGLRFNRSVKEFFDKFETLREVDSSNIEKFMKGKSSLHIDSKLRHINKSEPVLYSTPKSGTVEESSKVKYNWIARDEDGELYRFTHDPKADEDSEYLNTPTDMLLLDKDLYPEITFENSPQPWPLKEEKEPLRKEGEYDFSEKERELYKMVYKNIPILDKYNADFGQDLTIYDMSGTYHLAIGHTSSIDTIGILFTEEMPLNEWNKVNLKVLNYASKFLGDDKVDVFRTKKCLKIDESKDLISLVLGKMPFLDSEEIVLFPNKTYSGSECVDIVSKKNHNQYRFYLEDGIENWSVSKIKKHLDIKD